VADFTGKKDKTMARPYILVAPNGARRMQSDHSALPITLTQIVDCARDCHDAGADGIHVHVREDDGEHSLDAGRYNEVIRELAQQVPGMGVQITTESAGVFDVPEQLACLEQVAPAWASISVREVARRPDLADQLYGLCADQGTRVQHILYDAADAAQLKQWQEAGIVRASQAERILVLGQYAGGIYATPEDLDTRAPQGGAWAVCAVGPQEHACLLRAAGMGADLRVGFENSLTDAQGTPWQSNAESVAALVAQLEGTRS
jgi:uncharacterized protein (DUF849 family)